MTSRLMILKRTYKLKMRHSVYNTPIRPASFLRLRPRMRHDIGEDTKEFRPERWLEASFEETKNMERAFFSASVVFCCHQISILSPMPLANETSLKVGFGSRACIRKNISVTEIGKVVPQIFRRLDIKWASDSPERKTNTAWFWKQTEIIVKMTSRQKY